MIQFVSAAGSTSVTVTVTSVTTDATSTITVSTDGPYCTLTLTSSPNSQRRCHGFCFDVNGIVLSFSTLRKPENKFCDLPAWQKSFMKSKIESYQGNIDWKTIFTDLVVSDLVIIDCCTMRTRVSQVLHSPCLVTCVRRHYISPRNGKNGTWL